MRILFITVRADVGGGQKNLFDLTSYYRDQYKIEMTIASPDEKPFADKFKTIVDDFITIPKRTFSFISFFKILNHCRKYNIQTVHTHGRGAGVYGRLLSLFGLKCIHTLHGIHIEDNIKGKLKLFLDRLLHSLTTHYIFVSHDEKQVFYDIGFSHTVPSTVIENGVDHLSIKEEFNSHREKRPSYTLGTLARLHYQKGIDLLIDTVSRKKDFLQDNNIQILIAGDGPDKDQLNQKVLDHGLSSLIQFTGQTFSPVRFLATLDCYISFARWEGLPLSVLEAKACQLPTLLSNVVGHQNFDYRFNNDDEFIEKLNSIIKEEVHPLPLEEKFTLSHMAKKTFLIYQGDQRSTP